MNPDQIADLLRKLRPEAILQFGDYYARGLWGAKNGRRFMCGRLGSLYADEVSLIAASLWLWNGARRGANPVSHGPAT